MRDIRITDRATKRSIDLSINGQGAGFELSADQIVAAAVAPIDPLIDDLLHIAASVFAADALFARGTGLRSDMGVAWRRNLHVTIPVRRLEVWSDPRVNSALVEALEFLSEDSFSFAFIPSPPAGPVQGLLDFDPRGRSFEADEVILFSGGLDSFAGALSVLASTDRKVVLVSHRSAQKVMPRQKILGEYLQKRFPGRVLHIKVIGRMARMRAPETTQRTRSLLFAALGEAVAASFGARHLSFYENGIVSQNLAIGPQVVGAMASRTTHPLTITRLNALLEAALPNPVRISNPFAWLTKAEVVKRIADHGGEAEIRSAVSCTAVRDQTVLHPHCGRCSQCLDRRFGILAAGRGNDDPAEGYATDVLIGERSTSPHVTMAAEWTRHAVRLARIDRPAFEVEFGLEITRIAAGFPEMTRTEVVEACLNLQRRHGKAVVGVLEEEIARSASLLAIGELPSTSLLRMHLGGTAAETGPDAERSLVSAGPHDDAFEADLVPDPDAPLEVAFFEEKGKPVVAVTGLCRVSGSPALIPHALKPIFDEDRSRGLKPAHHRFEWVHTLPSLNFSKDAARKNVSRCRAALAEAFEDLHGVPPQRPLLIESGIKGRFRLDPTIRLTSSPGE